MKYTLLPETDIKVSKICLGTMTWGKQNSEQEGHEQMNFALEKGVNFFDTAELYPVPAEAETYGETERIIGTWFKKTGQRQNIILASKIAGPGAYTKHIRTTGFKKEASKEAVHLNDYKQIILTFINYIGPNVLLTHLEYEDINTSQVTNGKIISMKSYVFLMILLRVVK